MDLDADILNNERNGIDMAKRELSKPTEVERMFKILEYLKKNTDCEHPITQAEMRKAARYRST